MLKKHGFIIALVGVVILAGLFPGLGARDGMLKAGLLSKLGVMVIFFLQGLSLKTSELAEGLKDLRLHAFIQGWIFLFAAFFLFPAAVCMRAMGHPDIANGFLYLILVPTTISSAVAFSSAAGGNVPAAIFNVTLANLLGVFWVPTGCLLFFASSGGLSTELLLPLLGKIAQLILLPLLVGQILRPFVRDSQTLARIQPSFKVINHSIILFIIFAALAQSFLSKAWDGISPWSLSLLLLLTLIIVLLIHAGTWWSSGQLGLKHADRVTALFCGSQKTLAAGAPMAVAIFAEGSALAGINLGLLLLPLLCFHPIQLLVAALILPRLAN
ncbi:MAG: bile acid:sodium symporter [Puniceicoccaceae bacterium]